MDNYREFPRFVYTTTRGHGIGYSLAISDDAPPAMLLIRKWLQEAEMDTPPFITLPCLANLNPPHLEV